MQDVFRPQLAAGFIQKGIDPGHGADLETAVGGGIGDVIAVNIQCGKYGGKLQPVRHLNSHGLRQFHGERLIGQLLLSEPPSAKASARCSTGRSAP